MKRTFGAGAKLLLMAAIVLASAGEASANISVEPRLENPLVGIATLIAINFGTDLFLIATAVFVAFTLAGKGIGDIPKDPTAFVVAVVLTGAMVAITGGVIDFILLYEKAEDGYVLGSFDLRTLVTAAVLIFVTIAVFLHLFAGVRLSISTACAAAIAPLSPLAWLTISATALGFLSVLGGLLILTTSLLALIDLFGLYYLHLKVGRGALDRAYEGAETG